MVERGMTARQMEPKGEKVVRDLREQMTIAKGWAQLLREYTTRDHEWYDEQVLRRALARIETATTRMSALLEQTLTAPDPPASA